MLAIHLLAQAAAAATPEAVATQQEGVISYPASFFAAQQPLNAQEMLTRVPGFTLDSGSSVRGFEGAAGNVLIDGQRPTTKTDNLDEVLRRVPASQVERIDIIRGGAPGIDMQGKTVLANVIRKKGAGFRGLFAVANNHVWDGRNMHGMRLELSGGSGDRTWETSARYGYGNDDGGNMGPRLRISPSGAIIGNASVRNEGDGNQETLTGAYAQPLAGGQIRLNGRAFWNKWKFEERDRFFLPTGKPDEVTTDITHERQTELGARYDRDFGPRTKLESMILRQDYKNRDGVVFSVGPDQSLFGQRRTSSETIGRGVLKFQQSSTLSFEAGAEGALNVLNSHSSYAENGHPVTIPADDIRVEENRGEAFAKGTWRPTPAWTLEAGVRLEGSRIQASGDVDLEKTLTFVKPRVAASWAATPTTQIRARVERVVGQLNFDDFVAGADFNNGQGVSAGNPDLDPEQAWVLEGAVEQRFWAGVTGVFTYRHSELTDVIDRGPVTSASGTFDNPMNIGSGTKDEVSVDLTIPLDATGLKGALLKGQLNKRWSEVTDPTTHTERTISRLRPLEWNITYAHDLPAWRLSYGVDVYSGWSQTSYRFDSIQTVKLHNTWIQPWIEKRLPSDVTVRFEVRNAGQRGIRIARQAYGGRRDVAPLLYTDDRDLAAGRMFYVRVRKSFGG